MSSLQSKNPLLEKEGMYKVLIEKVYTSHPIVPTQMTLLNITLFINGEAYR